MPNPQDQNDEQIRYVILTQDILADTKLQPADKFVLARITGFREFFEAAEETARILGMSERTVKTAKQRLIALGYIEEIANTGRGKRYRLKSITGSKRCKISTEDMQKLHIRGANRSTQTCKTEHSEVQICALENKERIKRETSSKEEDEPATPKRYGNETINALLDAWAEATGFNYKNQKMERYALNGLVKQHGLDRTKELISLVKQARQGEDRYAPQIAKPSQLRGKYSKLEALLIWSERRQKTSKEPEKPRGPILKPFEFEDDTASSLTKEERHEISERCRKIAFGGKR